MAQDGGAEVEGWGGRMGSRGREAGNAKRGRPPAVFPMPPPCHSPPGPRREVEAGAVEGAGRRAGPRRLGAGCRIAQNARRMGAAGA